MQNTSIVSIISTQVFQSELLALFIRQKIGLTCEIKHPSEISSPSSRDEKQRVLLLWDCHRKKPEDFWSNPVIRNYSRSKSRFLALFNVEKDDRIEHEAFRRGIRGIFFENIDADLLAKGIDAIMNGEIWYSRECMMAFLISDSRPVIPAAAPPPLLTQRENHVLTKVASGLSTNEIAHDLFISPATVKTHIRNIYKKIQVNNRFEAARWAARNF